MSIPMFGAIANLAYVASYTGSKAFHSSLTKSHYAAAARNVY